MTSTTAPDLILHGGPILTLDDGPLDVTRAGGGPVGDLAVAIGDGRIMVVGAARDVLALASGSTRLVDLQGAAVLPGFQDQHAHPLVEGLQAGWLDLTRAPDLRAALRLLAGAAAEARSSVGVERWVEAWYHPSAWREGRHPTRDELDRIVPDVPLLLHHGSGHAAVANSLALAYAGITAERPDPPGATIERDDSGEPTGMVMGSDPAAPFAAALPPLTPETLRDALRRAGARLAAAGVTAVADAHLGGLGDPVSELAAYAGAVLDGDFPQRLTVMPGLAHLSAVDEDPPTPGDIGALVPPDVGTASVSGPPSSSPTVRSARATRGCGRRTRMPPRGPRSCHGAGRRTSRRPSRNGCAGRTWPAGSSRRTRSATRESTSPSTRTGGSCRRSLGPTIGTGSSTRWSCSRTCCGRRSSSRSWR